VKKRGVISPITLRDVYHEPGDYTAKFLIDPRESTQIESVAVSVRNSDGHDMPHQARRWGTKLTVSFKIDQGVPDGVIVIDVSMTNRSKSVKQERFSAWTIK
jgi:hypothetical protein